MVALCVELWFLRSLRLCWRHLGFLKKGAVLGHVVHAATPVACFRVQFHALGIHEGDIQISIGSVEIGAAGHGTFMAMALVV